MENLKDLTKSNDFVPYRLTKRALDRTLLPLRDAIRSDLSKRSAAVVLDIATGGGLLAAWAAECQVVQRVYAVEDDPLMIAHTRKALANHPYRDRIILVETDNLLTYEPSEPCDLLLCEVLSTMLIQQPQVPLLNQALKFLKSTGAVLPSGMTNTITLLDFDFRFCNSLIRLPCVFEDELHLLRTQSLSEQCIINRLCFDQPLPDSTEKIVQIPVVTSGWARAVRLETQVLLGTQQVEYITTCCQPIIAPLPESFFVKKGQLINLKCIIAHRQTDTDGRASACTLPEHLDISLV